MVLQGHHHRGGTIGSVSAAEWAAETRRPIKTEAKEKKKGTGREETYFSFLIDGKYHEIQAYTRGEARSKLMRNLGVDSLPPGCARSSRPNKRKAKALVASCIEGQCPPSVG